MENDRQKKKNDYRINDVVAKEFQRRGILL